jgi:heme/copper-type cytochrome/quinol oxidase subunit 2
VANDTFRQIAWIVVAFAVFCWIAYGWMAATGTSFSTRFSDEGRNVGAREMEHARSLAILATMACAIVLVAGSALRRK